MGQETMTGTAGRATGRPGPTMILAVVGLACWTAPYGAAQPTALRYRLRSGDHLVYREQLAREVVSEQSATETRIEWSTHVLVLEPVPGRFIVGFQRDRTPAELLRFREAGRDRTAAERVAFDERTRRSRARFARRTSSAQRGLPHCPGAGRSRCSARGRTAGRAIARHLARRRRRAHTGVSGRARA